MHPLDNCIYQALTTSQRQFAQVNGPACRYIPEVTSLAGFSAPTPDAYSALAELIEEGKTTGVVVDKAPESLPQWRVLRDTPLLQMVYEPTSVAVEQLDTVELSAPDNPEMLALAELTKPGPFGTRTHELGRYIGLRQEGKLIAMAGERVRVPDFTEISAVCTHPDHAGHGYARRLMNILIADILGRGETPFLHVRADNDRAIGLYERMGFFTRYSGRHVVIRKL